MKLTKSKLKQIIKEELETVFSEQEEEEYETVDLNTMDPNEAFGFAWNKAIEILQGAGHEEAACLLSAEAGEIPMMSALATNRQKK